MEVGLLSHSSNSPFKACLVKELNLFLIISSFFSHHPYQSFIALLMVSGKKKSRTALALGWVLIAICKVNIDKNLELMDLVDDLIDDYTVFFQKLF